MSRPDLVLTPPLAGLPDLKPWVLVRCDTCPEDHNCHPPEEMVWSRPFPGAAPCPTCESCWDESENPEETNWFALPPVKLEDVK